MKIIIFFLTFSLITIKAQISGVAFYNYNYNLSDKISGPEKNSFSLDRVYFTYKSIISDELSFTFQTDVGNVGDDERLTTYLKKAQLIWKGPFNISLGMQGMNMFNVKEKTWGFRFIEKSPMDKHKFSSSADMGLGISGNNNNLSYNFLITNGSGYKKQETDAYKKTSVQFVYGKKRLNENYGFNLGTNISNEPYSKNNVINVISFFSGFSNKKIRFGGEYDLKIDTGIDETERITAFYSSYQLNEKLEGLIYFDSYNSNVKTINNSKNYIILGFNYYPTKGFIVSPNLRMIFFEDEIEGERILKINFQFKF